MCKEMKLDLRRSFMRFLLFVLILGISFSVPSIVNAQVNTPRFSHLTSEDGLSNNMVRCILQDNQGFMWFGTQDGLNKYDGYTFTVYRHLRSDGDSLSNSTVTALHQDRMGVFWIGTVVGLDSFSGSGNVFNHHQAIEEEVNVIYEDSSGILWIGTASAGLFRYDREIDEFTQFIHDPEDPYSLSDDEVLSIYEDRSGILWVGSAYSGLNSLDISSMDGSSPGVFATRSNG